MARRTFADRDGERWEIIPGRTEWQFDPIEGNPGPSRSGASPGYETDPYELSVEELQRLLDAARPRRPSSRKSPFLD
ncbi:MAG TPA: hypothetical protein VMF70_09840 [Gemmatimonadales bacterium]|nr:hypothetical protein [Gemmatimonadales bacterium]